MTARRVLAVSLAVVALLGIGGPAGVPAARAATPDLTVVGSARYVVQPDRHRVRVTVDLTLTNHLADTKTRRYYFDEAFLAVMPTARAYRLTWDGGGTPSVSASKRTKDYTILRLGLGQRLYSGKTAHYRLRFDIVDPGGKATRDIRIGDSLVSFPVWAFASDATPGSTVSVTFPKGFQVDVEAGSIGKPTTDDAGRVVLRSGRIAEPLRFYAYLVGDRPGAYKERTIAPEVGGEPAEVVIRAWPDDAAWDKRVGGTIDRALPVLGEAIGLPWPPEEPLVVQEAVSRSTGGYAGLFDPTAGRVEVAYYADAFVVLHESAHAWFNGALLADRWANEAFASWYALDAARTLKVKATGDELTKAKEKARIPLNAWGAVGREATATEDYAYAASLALARAIAERAGPDGLRAVWADAAGRVGAYQPADATTPVLVEGAPDWRGLLDLLEDDTDAAYDDLWREWVARPEDLPLLDARAIARDRYDEAVAAAGDWRLPDVIGGALRAWRFDEATTLMDGASEALEARSTVEAAAAAAGLQPPEALRTAFEDADGFDDAMAEAAAERTAIERYKEATAARPLADPFLALGLWGEDPEAILASARTAFAAGDLAASVERSDAAAHAWTGAAELGRGRAFSLALLGLAAVLALLLGVAWLRGRRRRRARSWMQAHRLEP